MIGRTFTNYRVVSELGAGAMGVVYKAVDLRLNRQVALKVLPPENSGDAERRSRFLQEARAASALNDPHIVTIYDIFTDADTDVLVMELVQGRTLREVIADGPMTVAAALDVAAQIAEGVASAHAVGIVHRDLKPGNVMVTDRGRVKVLDFGLAKLFGDALAQQQTMMAPTIEGTLLGTVDYMSPEQARGETVDGRSDVFSLGAMVYEMLTGVRPFTAAHLPGVLHEILYGSLTPPRARRPDVPLAAETIVVRALERDVARRYQTMDALASDLRQVQRQAESPSTAAPAVIPPPLPHTAAVPPAIPQSAMRMPPPLDITPAPGSSSSQYPVLAMPAGTANATDGDEETTGRTRARERGDRPKKRSGRSRLFWAVIIGFMLFGPARQWLRNNSAGSGDERARDDAEQQDADPDPGSAVGDVPGLGNLGSFIEDRVISGLETAVRNAPNSAKARVDLAQMYWRRAKSTNSAEYRRRATEMFNEALRIEPDNADAKEGLREIAASQPQDPAAP